MPPRAWPVSVFDRVWQAVVCIDFRFALVVVCAPVLFGPPVRRQMLCPLSLLKEGIVVALKADERRV